MDSPSQRAQAGSFASQDAKAGAGGEASRPRALLERFRLVRGRTERLAGLLSPEDQQLQAFPDASPTKWHRAHTTWFFEEFALADEPRFHAQFAFAFNSYYDSVGSRHHRPERGLLSRPSSDDIARYRADVDERVLRRIERADDAELARIAPIVTLGTHHEEQHQELMLTDILAAFARNPLGPSVRSSPPHAQTSSTLSATWTKHDGGLVDVGADITGGFAFDNETPRHRVFVAPFELRDQWVTVREVKAFVDDGGYANPLLWLSAGFAWAQSNRIEAPAYLDLAAMRAFGVDGWRELDDDEPASFVSFYEADAIARFLGARLPTEFEWEHAAQKLDANAFVAGNWFVDETSALRPLQSKSIAGEAWAWTRSAYEPYPGFRAGEGALGEYNGKFMIGQQVLRGGSAFTPAGHARATYRNFWPPETRFQLTGIRLARDHSRK